MIQNTIRHYRAYGQVISSEISLPEFSIEKSPGRGAETRIHLHSEKAPDSSFAGKPWFFDVTRDWALLYFSGVAVFSLVGGSEIYVTPVPGADYRLIELYLSGTVFSVLLYQQGRLVFHASSVVVGGGRQAILFVGESGIGKSSLAAILNNRGHQFIADDVCALEEQDDYIQVVPAYPYIKLDPKTAKYLHFDKKRRHLIHENEQKMFFPCFKPYTARSSCVRALFILSLGETVGSHLLDNKEAMIETIRHTVPSRLLHAAGDTKHFSQCAAVVAKVPVYLLERTANPESLRALADLAERQCR